MTTNPPAWLPADLRQRYVPVVPKGSEIVGGPFAPSEAWMLKRLKAEPRVVIAPFRGGVGTYRLSPNRKATPAKQN